MHPYLVPQLRQDLQEIVDRSEDDLRRIGDRPLVITGSSGFVGTWLTLSYLEAKRAFKFRGDVTLVSRNPADQADLLRTSGYDSGFQVLASDVRSLSSADLPKGAELIQAATPARASLNSNDPLEMLDIIIEGQRNLLQISASMNFEACLFLSSGAVYGTQPLELKGVDESYMGAPDVRNSASAYHEGKRVAELMGNMYAADHGIRFVSARLFAFLAPFLPTNEHFAAGNFIGDAIAGRNISINSGGGSIRSYQYGTDMAVWLWALLARGTAGLAYNVGSEEEVSITALARKVARSAPSPVEVEIKGLDSPTSISRYVPSTATIKSELQVGDHVSLDDAIYRTIRWSKDLDD